MRERRETRKRRRRIRKRRKKRQRMGESPGDAFHVVNVRAESNYSNQ